MSREISTIAKNIKRLRKKLGISQDKLSKLANVSHNTIIKIESGGIQNPTIGTIQKIAQVLDVSIDELLNLNKYRKK